MAATDLYGLVGQVLDGQFRVDRAIGEGGFSVVYRGQHIGLDEPVAIKCLKLQTQLGSAVVEGFIRRFRDESKIHYRLSRGSLHIARTIAAGTTMAPAMGALVPYMVLEWLEGYTLSEELRARRQRHETGRSLQEVIRLLDPVAEAMAFAHAQGVVHRDLNPSNIFVAHAHGTSTLKVLDFGVAKVISDHALALGPRIATMGQIRMFTPAYAAPEQFHEALGQIGPQTDVYSFAVVVVELLADRTPIEGDHIGEYADRALDPERRPTPRSMGIAIGDAAEAVIARAVTVDPSQRPSDVGAFWGMLKNAVSRDAQQSRLGGEPGFPKSPMMAAPSARGAQMPMPRTTAGRLPAPEPQLSVPPAVPTTPGPGGEDDGAAGRYFYSSRPAPPMDDESPPPKQVVDVYNVSAAPANPAHTFSSSSGNPLAQTRQSATDAPANAPRDVAGPVRKATLLHGSPLATPQPAPNAVIASVGSAAPLPASPSFASTLTTPASPSFGTTLSSAAPAPNHNAPSHQPAPQVLSPNDFSASGRAQVGAGGGAPMGSGGAHLGDTAASASPFPPASPPAAPAPAPRAPAAVAPDGAVWHSPTLSHRAPIAPRAEPRSSTSPPKAKSKVPLLIAVALALTITLVVVAIVANQLAH